MHIDFPSICNRAWTTRRSIRIECDNKENLVNIVPIIAQQFHSILVTARMRLERVAISDGIERGGRGRETANLRFSGIQPQSRIGLS